MEYIIMIGIALLVFLALFLIIKVEKIRNRANALFLEVEKYMKENDIKFDYVCDKLYSYVPSAIKFFINEQFFKTIVQMMYDNTRKVAKDLLDDGKWNNSYK
ncbi:MAG: hypothetical protein HFJ52_03985 [Clostridia bacterium]|nr:hypothetical protein [Clostridia bacterium]